MDNDEYFENAAYGTKIYVAREKIEDTPKALKTSQRLWVLDKSTKILFTCWILHKLLFANL